MFKHKQLLITLLLFSFFFRTFRLATPARYIFDEVYHVVTIKAYSQNNPAGYEWWHQPPEPNTAYDWLHPPLAKLIQATSIKLFGDHSLAWRLPSAIFGTLSILALYLFALAIFKKPTLALISAFIFSLDGLQLTMSRITMNDIFLTTWLIFALKFFYQYLTTKTKTKTKKYLYLTGIFTGLSLATKHSAILLYPIFTIFLLPRLKTILKQPKKILIIIYSLLLTPLLIYLLSYSQFFLQGHTLDQFKQLHQQIYWYQTNLSATHDYQSPAWQWPLLIRPVWFHVDYFKNSIANIYNLGNPAIFWGGLISLIYLFTQKLTSKTKYLLTCYFLLFFPFVFSPRIMFLHHYLPALSFLSLIIAQAIHKNKKLTFYFLILTTILFLFFYPINTAINLPQNLLFKYWFWLPTWR
jgi:dolichyl-phosphate-mannose--protein O-mannosyl transferase